MCILKLTWLMSYKYISSEIDHEVRAMEKPSDHCPVVLDLDLEFI